MSHTRLGLVLVLLLCIVGPVSASVGTSSPNAPVLPDNGCLDDTNGTGGGGITDMITFNQTGNITDVNIRVEMTQTWRADIQAAVTYTGGGGTVVLANNHDTSGDNYNATFDSEAALPCSDATLCGLTTGSPCETAPGPICRPNQSLTSFNGLTCPGTFTLAVCDRAAGDLGNLVLWEVTVTGDGGHVPVELQTFSIE
ncbi:MAG: hypothetical protein HC897_18270 [Thermoanaerobaculia bacterium]|nr:hypothetical protein [Thermoanaerobaculia bacterium]